LADSLIQYKKMPHPPVGAAGTQGQPMDPKAETPQPGAQTPSRKRISRRTSIIGSVIAVVAWPA